MKRALSLALLLTLLAGAAAHGSSAITASQFLHSLAIPGACGAATMTTGQAAIGTPMSLTQDLCFGRHCTTDEECACSGAATAVCGSDFSCHYTYDGGGGGGGLGCPQAHCFDDSQCLANCPAGPNSYCATNGTCVYVP
jgi:hypothetical protein